MNETFAKSKVHHMKGVDGVMYTDYMKMTSRTFQTKLQWYLAFIIINKN